MIEGTDNYKDVADWDETRPATVDVSKIKPGDYVTVRTKVLSHEANADVLPIRIDPNPYAYEIVAHEPGNGAPDDD